MVQENIDLLAEIEAKQILLREQLITAINLAKSIIDSIDETERQIFEMRQDIELQVNNN